MKLFHFTAPVAAASIISRGFDPGESEVKILEQNPWIDPGVLGQGGPGGDRVSFSLGGERLSSAWRRALAEVHGEISCLRLEISQGDFTRHGKVFFSRADTYGLFGRKSHGHSLEVTLPRGLVNDQKLVIHPDISPEAPSLQDWGLVVASLVPTTGRQLLSGFTPEAFWSGFIVKLDPLTEPSSLIPSAQRRVMRSRILFIRKSIGRVLPPTPAQEKRLQEILESLR